MPSSSLQVSDGSGTRDWQADASADAGPSVGRSGGGGAGGVLGGTNPQPQSKHRASLRADFTADPSQCCPQAQTSCQARMRLEGPPFSSWESRPPRAHCNLKGKGRFPAGRWEWPLPGHAGGHRGTQPPLKAPAPLGSIFCGAGRHRSQGPATTAPSRFCHHWPFL